MAISAKWYGLPIRNQYGGTDGTATPVLWFTDTIKTALTTSSYDPLAGQDSHLFFSSVTNEITGTNYTAGGVTLGSKTCTYDTSTNEMRLDAGDAVWSSASFTAATAVVYKSTGNSATSTLVSYVDFDADEVVAAGTFTIVWDSTGVAKITAS